MMVEQFRMSVGLRSHSSPRQVFDSADVLSTLERKVFGLSTYCLCEGLIVFLVSHNEACGSWFVGHNGLVVQQTC